MIVLPSQRHAQIVRDRLMNGKPPLFRSRIIEIRQRMEMLASKPVHEFEPLHLSATKEAISDGDIARMPNWRRITLEVAVKHHLKVSDLISQRRVAPFVLARHEAMWRLSKETDLTTTQIGRMFKRDHTTCISAVRKHQWRLDQEAGEV